MDDNWQRLYEAIIDTTTIAEAAGIADEQGISNALGFDDLPPLWLEDTTFTDIGQPWLCLAPNNSPTSPII
jgi:hypothetical protein